MPDRRHADVYQGRMIHCSEHIARDAMFCASAHPTHPNAEEEEAQRTLDKVVILAQPYA